MSTVTSDASTAEPLRIAVPNKGSLAEHSATMLREAGYRQRSDLRDLILQDPSNNVEFYFLRPRDIAVYVGSGRLDVGITGRDLLLDSGAPAQEVIALGFGDSTFRFACTPGSARSERDFEGRRVATAYPGLVRAYLERIGVDAEVVRLDGAVETAVRLGVADVIADVVSTGTTLRQAGLEIIGEPILQSEAILITRTGAEPTTAVELLTRRLQGVIIARQYVLMDYDVRADLVDRAVAITPGLESPTISPLHVEGWVAVRAMVPRRNTNQVMDDLWDLGARGILVTDIHACRL
jgi:ATP phosphoribosyltransferase